MRWGRITEVAASPSSMPVRTHCTLHGTTYFCDRNKAYILISMPSVSDFFENFLGRYVQITSGAKTNQKISRIYIALHTMSRMHGNSVTVKVMVAQATFLCSLTTRFLAKIWYWLNRGWTKQLGCESSPCCKAFVHITVVHRLLSSTVYYVRELK